jgi:hypothetical protein
MTDAASLRSAAPHVIHNLIDRYSSAQAVGSIFKPLATSGAAGHQPLKRRAAALYQDTYEESRTSWCMKVIHADETHLGTRSSNGYVCVHEHGGGSLPLVSTREGTVAEEFLSGFNGVLVPIYSA